MRFLQGLYGRKYFCISDIQQNWIHENGEGKK